MKKVAFFVAFCALVFTYGTSVSGELVTYVGEPATHAGGTDVILNDVSVDTAGARWLSAGFYAELSAGSLFQDPDAGTGVDAWGQVKMGTTLLNPVDSWFNKPVAYFAGANQMADLPGFSGDPANAAASVTFLVPVADGDPIPPYAGAAARFAFTPDAQGMWVMRNTLETAGNESFDYGYIVNGYMVPIPEPTTIALVLCGLVGLCVIRRK